MKLNRFDCIDCGINTSNEYYTLHDDTWKKIHPTIHGMLCILCAEKRLGRQLTWVDFTDCPLNRAPWFKRSSTLEDRLTIKQTA